MEVAFVTPRFHPHVGGIEESSLNLAAGLRSRGHRVTIHTLQTPGLSREDEHGGLRIRRYPAVYNRGYYVCRFEPEIDADIIHMHAYAHHTNDWVIDEFFGRARLFVSTHHGARFPQSWWKRLYHRRYNRRVGIPHLQRVLGVLAPTVYEAQDFVDRGVPVEKVHVVPSGVAEPGFEFKEPWAPPGLDPAKGFLLFLGRLHAEKGLADLVRAYRSTPVSVPLVVAGRDEGMADWLKGQAAKDARIRVLTTVTPQQRWGLLSACRALVLPSHHEGQGIVVAEAWAQRKPVITSDAGALPSVVTTGVNGLVVPVRDVEALAREMRRLLAEPDTARRLGLAGRQTAEAYYRWGPILDKVEGLYTATFGTRVDSTGAPGTGTTGA